MPSFSSKSKEKIKTCDEKLQVLFYSIIKQIDCTPIYCYRDTNIQFELFKKGRSFIDGKWVITNKKNIVTYKDGITNMSNHNLYPSKAIDIMPYFQDIPHIRWDHIKEICFFAGHVMNEAKKLNIDLVWGGDWNRNNIISDERFMDLAHYELRV